MGWMLVCFVVRMILLVNRVYECLLSLVFSRLSVVVYVDVDVFAC